MIQLLKQKYLKCILETQGNRSEFEMVISKTNQNSTEVYG